MNVSRECGRCFSPNLTLNLPSVTAAARLTAYPEEELGWGPDRWCATLSASGWQVATGHGKAQLAPRSPFRRLASARQVRGTC